MTVLQPTAAPPSGVQRLLLSEAARALASGVMRAITCCERGRLRIDPHLRGHVTPGTLARLASGFRVVRIGAAAYLRRGSERWIVGVWDGKDRPEWANRLDQHHRWLIGRGNPTPLEARREATWLRGYGK